MNPQDITATENLSAILERRGIASMATTMHWTPYRVNESWGWRYPVLSSQSKPYLLDGKEVSRWKNAEPEKGERKYGWFPKQHDLAKYYVCYNLPQMIKDANGMLWLARGEPDALTYWTAGLPALCWLNGESAIPESFVADMLKAGVNTIYDYVDCDKAGVASAKKIALLLKDSGIEYKPHALPYPMGSKKDINDYWIDLHFDREAFIENLMTLPALLLPTEIETPIQTQPLELDFGNLFVEWVKMVINALGSPAKHEAGLERWHCPAHPYLVGHPDNDPSFRITNDAGRFHPMCTCGVQSNPPKEAWDFVATGLSVPTWDEYKHQHLAETKHKNGGSLASPQNGVVSVSSSRIEIASEWRKNVVSSDESLEELDNILSGVFTKKLPRFVDFPFNRLHQFGGMAHVVSTRKMIYVTAVSGGGKTSFLEQMALNWMRQAYDVLIWGEEWSPIEYAMRAMQRAGGLNMTTLQRHIMFQADKQAGKSNPRGIDLTGTGAIKNSLAQVRALRSITGRAHYLQNMRSLEQMGETLMYRVEELKAQGRDPLGFYFDYVQYGKRFIKGDSAYWAESIASTVKSWCAELDLVAIVMQQPKKSASDQARDGKMLDESSKQGSSDQQCNLDITLNPQFSDDRTKTDHAIIGVSKNSTGENGDVVCPVDWKHLLYEDTKESTAKVINVH